MPFHGGGHGPGGPPSTDPSIWLLLGYIFGFALVGTAISVGCIWGWVQIHKCCTRDREETRPLVPSTEFGWRHRLKIIIAGCKYTNDPNVNELVEP